MTLGIYSPSWFSRATMSTTTALMTLGSPERFRERMPSSAVHLLLRGCNLISVYFLFSGRRASLT